MEFKVFTDDQGSHRTFEGGDRYHLEAGTLVVWTEEMKITFGPTGWHHIEEPRTDPEIHIL